MSSLASLPQADSPTLLPQRYASPSTAGYILYWVLEITSHDDSSQQCLLHDYKCCLNCHKYVAFKCVRPHPALCAALQVVFGIMTGAAVLFSYLTFKQQQKDRKHGCKCAPCNIQAFCTASSNAPRL
jgi:hypothetical protein